MIDIWSSSSGINLSWMPQDHSDERSTLVQVMNCCLMVPSHYLNQTDDPDLWRLWCHIVSQHTHNNRNLHTNTKLYIYIYIYTDTQNIKLRFIGINMSEKFYLLEFANFKLPVFKTDHMHFRSKLHQNNHPQQAILLVWAVGRWYMVYINACSTNSSWLRDICMHWRH